MWRSPRGWIASVAFGSSRISAPAPPAADGALPGATTPARHHRVLYIEDNPATGINAVQISSHGNLYRGRKNESKCNGSVTVDAIEDVSAPSSDLDPRSLGATECSAYELGLSTAQTRTLQQIAFDQLMAAGMPMVAAKTTPPDAVARCVAPR